MTAAPLLLACLLVPPGDAAAEAPRPRSVAELEALLDARRVDLSPLRPGDTLAEALDHFEVASGVVILPDAARLDPVGVDLRDLPIEDPPELEGIKLRSALNLLLGSVNDVPLTYLVVDGVLKITTQDYADEYLVTRVYRVRDLLEAAGPWVFSEADWRAAALLECLTPEPMVSSMGVMQSTPLVTAPRCAACEPDPPVEPTPADVVKFAEKRLVEVIMNSTGGLEDGGGWLEFDGEGGTLQCFNGILIVRQTQAVHRQIAALLADLRAADAAQPWTVPLAPPGPAAPDAATPDAATPDAATSDAAGSPAE